MSRILHAKISQELVNAFTRSDHWLNPEVTPTIEELKDLAAELDDLALRGCGTEKISRVTSKLLEEVEKRPEDASDLGIDL